MKVPKPILLEEDHIEKLKHYNASKLVRELLTDYFEGLEVQNIAKLKQIYSKKKKEKTVLLREMRKIEANIDKIKRKEARILNKPDHIKGYLHKRMEAAKKKNEEKEGRENK